MLIAGDLSPVLRGEFVTAVRAAARATTRRWRGSSRAPETAANRRRYRHAAVLRDDVRRGALPVEPRREPARSGSRRHARAIARLPTSATWPFDALDMLDLGRLQDVRRLAVRNACAPVSARDSLPNVPTLILSGADDLRTPTANAREVAAQIPDAHLLVVPDTGHSVLTSEPTPCARRALLAQFAGRPIKPCRAVATAAVLRPPPLPPTRLSQVSPAQGYSGRTGRTLHVARAHLLRPLAPARRCSWSKWSPRGSSPASPCSAAGACARAGCATPAAHSCSHGYSYVPGVTVSGKIGAEEADLDIGGTRRRAGNAPPRPPSHARRRRSTACRCTSAASGLGAGAGSVATSFGSTFAAVAPRRAHAGRADDARARALARGACAARTRGARSQAAAETLERSTVEGDAHARRQERAHRRGRRAGAALGDCGGRDAGRSRGALLLAVRACRARLLVRDARPSRSTRSEPAAGHDLASRRAPAQAVGAEPELPWWRSRAARGRPRCRSPRTSRRRSRPRCDGRDLIVFDQRGTGQSGALGCSALAALDGRGSASCRRSSNAARSSSGPRAAATRPPNRWRTSRPSAQALGYEKLVLYGTSYGTKVALDYAARYPRRRRSDGARLRRAAERTGTVRALDVPRDHARAPRTVRARTPAGASRRSPVGDVAKLLSRLRGRPLVGRIDDGYGHPQTLRLGALELLFILEAGDLNPALRALLPAAVQSALRGDAAPLLQLNALSEGLIPNVPPIPREQLRGRRRRSALLDDDLRRGPVPVAANVGARRAPYRSARGARARSRAARSTPSTRPSACSRGRCSIACAGRPRRPPHSR